MDARRLQVARYKHRSRRRFGAFSDDAETPAAAAEVLAAVDATFAAALGAEVVNAIASGETDILTLGTMSNNTQSTVLANMKTLIGQLADLHTRLLVWAINGKRDDGSTYSWAQWVDYAKTLGDGAAYQAKTGFDSSNFVAIASALKQTAVDPHLPDGIPWWAYAGGALCAAIGLSYVVRTFK